MSIRAHEVIKIETGRVAFNLSHDTEVTELLAIDLYDGLDIDGGGLTSIKQDTIEQALEEAKEERSKGILADMLGKAVANDGYVEYYCY